MFKLMFFIRRNPIITGITGLLSRAASRLKGANGHGTDLPAFGIARSEPLMRHGWEIWLDASAIVQGAADENDC